MQMWTSALKATISYRAKCLHRPEREIIRRLRSVEFSQKGQKHLVLINAGLSFGTVITSQEAVIHGLGIEMIDTLIGLYVTSNREGH